MENQLPSLVEVLRGPIIEARHRGVIVALEPDGRILARLGDENLITSTRSVIKPIQALPLITSGAAERFNITPRELAVACASHNGEPVHTEAVAGLLAKIGLDEKALLCGAHPPYNEDAARRLEREGKPFTQLHNNCSGKHAGMLATALHLGFSIEDYVSPNHPLQREIIYTLARMGELDREMPIGIDGCSAPTFGVPLKSLALAFARLTSLWSAGDSTIAEAAGSIVEAMTAHPEMIGGTKGRLDTDLLIAAGGRLICKVGAEAAYSIGVLPCRQFPHGLGIAIKIEDGSYRALGAVVVETLAQLGLLAPSEQARLAIYHRPAIVNHRGLNAGEVRANFDLEFDRR